jgi:hypothetical protein
MAIPTLITRPSLKFWNGPPPWRLPWKRARRRSSGRSLQVNLDYLFNPHPTGSSPREAHVTNLVCVVNTTGTPYYQHQPLRDVVIWYWLSEGIRDGILKEVSGNIQAFDFEEGKELAADAWLEDWNRLRARGDVPNRIEAIELRSDPRAGGFFLYQPAQAQIEISREGGEIQVEIQDFISPTILERLRQQSGLLAAQVTNWRAMVDCVMIDPAYNGQMFNIAVADVPERKADLVAGSYRLPAREGETMVAVKIVDMLVVERV